MLKRPEGLSPCYLSLVSPDVPDSMLFAWTFRGVDASDYQTKFTLTIYDIYGTALKSTTVDTKYWYYDISQMNYSFVNGTRYMWTVKTYNRDGLESDWSMFAAFTYDACLAVPSVTWTYIPKQGEVVVRDTYFAEFRSNLVTMLGDYEDVPVSTITKVNNLFMGEIVPNRKDFDTFQEVINYLSNTLEYQSDSIDIYTMISDSLGISDLEKIRNYIDNLLTIPPKPVQTIDINAPIPSMYKVLNQSAISDGKEDTTIQVSWDVESIQPQTGSFVFTKVSPSKDIRYYLVTFDYGPSMNSFSCVLYYKDEWITDGKSYNFDVNWQGLYDANTLSQAQHSLRVVAVDHRGNKSDEVNKVKAYGTDLKVPMGVDHYEVNYQFGALTDIGCNTNGSWLNVNNSTSKSIIHTVSGASGKFFYRVRAIDVTSLASDWVYTNGVVFDPLKPPGVPQNLKTTWVGVTDVALVWDTVPTAEHYEVNRYRYNYYGDGPHDGTGFGDQTDNHCSDLGCAANSIYNYFVRAKNRAGNSDWACITVQTDRYTHESSWDSVHCHSYKSGHWYSDQGVGHTYSYMGEWQGGGNNIGTWYFDYDNMRSVLSGAEITSAAISVERMSAGYSTTPYYPRFYLHGLSTADWSKNHSTAPVMYAPPDYGTWGWVDWNTTFVAGERKWVKLPNEYIQWIRDGIVTGIGIYSPDGSPYMKFNNWAQIWVQYKK